MITLPNGRRRSISGTPAINTKTSAEAAERAHIHRMMYPQSPEAKGPENKEVPTFRDFAPTYLASKRTKKQSYYETRESILNTHLVPSLGTRRLDEIGFAEIQDYATAKLSPRGEDRALMPKTVNNHLSVIRQVLVLAHKRGLVEAVPEVDWCRTDPSNFDFLTFQEAKELVLAADAGQWKRMMIVALNTGMRMGELRGLHWESVNFDDRSLQVVHNFVRGRLTTPKSKTSRRVLGLNDAALEALKAQRHLCGPMVFHEADGSPVKKGRMRWPLWRACDRANLGRRIGWHALRHTFASHLVMRGASLKVVQELLGHATIEMTMRYAHLSPDVKRDAVQLLCEPVIATSLQRR